MSSTGANANGQTDGPICLHIKHTAKRPSWQKPFPVIGQGVLVFNIKRATPFAISVQEEEDKNWISLDIHEHCAAFYMKSGGTPRLLQQITAENCGLEIDVKTTYWYSYDRERLVLKYGKGYRMEETTLMVHDFLKGVSEEKEQSNIRRQLSAFFNPEKRIFAMLYDTKIPTLRDQKMAISYIDPVIKVSMVIILLTPAAAVVPSNIIQTAANVNRLGIIKSYFFSGLLYTEIILLLFVIHGIKLSLRQLKRILKANSLCRNKNYSREADVRDLISAEIENSAKCIGYRSMWRRLVNDHHIRVPRDMVLQMMREIDPEGVRQRKAHRLVRRRYYAHGPNYVWHVDGYDKLKPYGFCIHGAVDGYSRRILWLEVSNSNNSSAVIAKYYLETLDNLGVCPRLLRCDRGTENAKLSVLQPFFRYNDTDSLSGMKSFMYGKSVSNQRIESWWGILRRQGIQWWMCYFKDMQDTNTFDVTNPVHVECLRYCFMDVIQAELDRIVQHWNLHEIRSQRHSDIPSGKPELLYFVPEIFGGRDYGHHIDLDDLEVCLDLYSSPKKMYSEDIEELAYCLLPQHQKPRNPDDAYVLYRDLLQEIERFI